MATKFSISVPVGAYHDLMPTCFASLACQSERLHVSLLDASNDPRVAALADRYDGLFAYRRHGPDAGQSAAIIEGWNETSGEILGWLNADDFLFPDAVQSAYAVFDANPSVDVVAGHSAICDEKGRMTGYHWAAAPPGENLRSGCVISQPSCFFRRAAYEKAGGLDAALHYTMDWDLWLRLLGSGAEFQFINEILSVVYWGDGTKTLGMKPARRAELLRLINAYTPAKLKFRTKRGFYLRALLDEMKPASVSRFIESKLRRKTPFVFGVGPRGKLAATAEIIWTHFEDEPKNELVILLEHANAVEVQSVDRPARIVNEGDGFRILFDEPVTARSVVSVRLNAHAARSSRLISCHWAQGVAL
ncbi:MAG: glycosyltransferase [Pseudomonadota bacterium]